MWPSLAKLSSLVAITSILFVSLMIGMAILSKSGGEAWGLDHSLSAEEAARTSFESGDYRLLSIRLAKNRKVTHELVLGAQCWPENRNEIEYEYDSFSQGMPDKGAHNKRAEFARRYNFHLASWLIRNGQKCKLWQSG